MCVGGRVGGWVGGWWVGVGGCGCVCVCVCVCVGVRVVLNCCVWRSAWQKEHFFVVGYSFDNCFV